ncbi:hypothetical protein IPH25_00740 [bacterium]|nr:MAG: hypothetical protein IPG37_02860 [bacterium]QQR61956.1 MAG: hypothetical protein IPH25_00740 [bacterium]
MKVNKHILLCIMSMMIKGSVMADDNSSHYSMVSNEVFDMLESQLTGDATGLKALHQVFIDLYNTLDNLTAYREKVYLDYKGKLNHDRTILDEAKALLAQIIADGTREKLALQIQIDDTTKTTTQKIHDLEQLIEALNNMIYSLHQNIDTLEDLSNNRMTRIDEMVGVYNKFAESRHGFGGDMTEFLSKVRAYLGRLEVDNKDMSDFADHYEI